MFEQLQQTDYNDMQKLALFRVTYVIFIVVVGRIIIRRLLKHTHTHTHTRPLIIYYYYYYY